MTPTRCDFCSDRRPRWIYPCPSFNLDNVEGFPAGWGSDGDWAACEACSQAIEAEDWAALAQRAQDALVARARLPEAANVNMQAVQIGFRQHRSGPRRAVPAEAPPATMASVYSRALDEQARLVALMERPAMHQAMLDAVTDAHGAERGQHLVDLTYASVAQSEAGYVSKLVCAILEQTSDSVPDATLEPEHLLAPNGFLLLAEPFILPMASARDIPPRPATDLRLVRAWSWYTYGPAPGDGTDHPRGGIYLVAWVAVGQRFITDIVPANTLTWGFGETWRHAAERRQHAAEGVNAEATGRWFTALHAFCQQRLVASRRGTPERATRRRLERAGCEPSDVLVVELRRLDQRRSEPSGEHRQIAADFSFSVTGHWRQQPYPSLGGHRPRWIAPYLKGNLEAPLRKRRRVFAIVH